MFIEIPASNKSIGQRKSILNVATNDAEYVTSHINAEGVRSSCPYYKKWGSMIRRCYSELAAKNRPTYENCFVCDDWLRFSSFKSWMVSQDWIGKDLDKDILFPGNKCYSPSTCLFVSPEVNSVMIYSHSKSSSLPIGITFSGKKYTVRCHFGGKRIYLGKFSSLHAAVNVYNKAKFLSICEVANRQVEPLRSAMIGAALNY